MYRKPWYNIVHNIGVITTINTSKRSHVILYLVNLGYKSRYEIKDICIYALAAFVNIVSYGVLFGIELLIFIQTEFRFKQSSL